MGWPDPPEQGGAPFVGTQLLSGLASFACWEDARNTLTRQRPTLRCETHGTISDVIERVATAVVPAAARAGR